MPYSKRRVAYSGGEASLRGPDGRIWPDDFLKQSFLGDPTNFQLPLSAARGGEAWRQKV